MIRRSRVRDSLTKVLLVLALSLMTAALGCGQKKAEEGKAEEPARTETQSETGEEGAAAETAGGAEGELVVKPGNTVTVQYRGTLSDGEIFDQSTPDRPFVFTAGVGKVIPGFDKAVIGMKLNEEKTVTIPADQAYGPANPKLIRTVPRTFFAPDFNPELGQEIPIMTQSGRTLRGVLVEATEDSLRIDFNHKLAGKDLTFDIKVIAIE